MFGKSLQKWTTEVYGGRHWGKNLYCSYPLDRSTSSEQHPSNNPLYVYYVELPLHPLPPSLIWRGRRAVRFVICTRDCRRTGFLQLNSSYGVDPSRVCPSQLNPWIVPNCAMDMSPLPLPCTDTTAVHAKFLCPPLREHHPERKISLEAKNRNLMCAIACCSCCMPYFFLLCPMLPDLGLIGP